MSNTKTGYPRLSYNVYGIGNAIMDLQVQCKDEFLRTIEIEKGVMTLVDENRQRKVLNYLSDHPVNLCSGGSACNTMVGIAGFGGTAAYACKVGSDSYGDAYIKELNELGVSMKVNPKNGRTGTCLILVTDDAQRTLLTDLGVSSELEPSDIDEKEIAKAEYIYIEGYLFNGNATKAAALKGIELAKKNSKKVALTLSDPFLVGLYKDDFWELLKGSVDLLFCNLEEARRLTGLEKDIDCARQIHRYVRNVALTLGDKGSLIMHDDKIITIDGVNVNAVDSTGAGDMYAAGVLYGITNGLTWEQSGILGSHSSARVVSQMGARLEKKITAEEIKNLQS